MGSTEMEMDSGLRYCAASSVLVASDSEEGRAALDLAAASVDARVLAAVPLDGLQERLAQTVNVDAVLIHASEIASGDTLGRLIGQLDIMTAENMCRAVAVVPHAMIDAVYAQMSQGDIIILSEPDTSDIVAALALACVQRPFRLNDVSGAAAGSQLVQLSEEVGRIARTLANLAENAPRVSRLELAEFTPPPPMTADVASAAGARVRNLIRARRARDQFFRSELFADPAWDMLLDLMAARLEHKRVSVSSLCIAAAVPATTALRWIKSMTDEGLFVRRADNNDGRRIFIDLSDRTAAAMSAYLEWLRGNALEMV